MSALRRPSVVSPKHLPSADLPSSVRIWEGISGMA